MKKVYRKLTEKEYYEEKIQLALESCPRIYPCAKCGHAVLDGYCCTTCRDSNPQLPYEDED
jgi:hypothetical protein